jgi:hypothetical protein
LNEVFFFFMSRCVRKKSHIIGHSAGPGALSEPLVYDLNAFILQTLSMRESDTDTFMNSSDVEEKEEKYKKEA